MNVALGISGGIAAYKSAQIVRRLAEHGEVQVIFTRSAGEFVTPLTFSVLSRRPVIRSLFDDPASPEVQHVDLAQWADLLLVAPATAEVIGKFAHGLADDFLSIFYLSYRGKVLLAPAMETAMWENPAVQQNMTVLAGRGVRTIGPDSGPLASGRNGSGRMAEPEQIVRAAFQFVEGKDDLADLPVLVTAGPTREPIDNIRFVTNRSSGKMGFALAEAARDRGARVVLLAGPTDIPVPAAVAVRRYETATQLYSLLQEEFERCRVLVMSAAVSDFIPERAPRRLHRSDGPRTVTLTPGLDVLASLSPKKGDRLVVAFAAEEGDGEEHARQKMLQKDADWIVLNDVSRPGTGFAADENEAILLSAQGGRIEISRRSKRDVAEKIWDAISSQLAWRKIPEPS